MLWLFFIIISSAATRFICCAGNEAVVTKVGDKTHGLARSFSSIYTSPLPELSLFVLSLVAVK